MMKNSHVALHACYTNPKKKPSKKIGKRDLTELVFLNSIVGSLKRDCKVLVVELDNYIRVRELTIFV